MASPVGAPGRFKLVTPFDNALGLLASGGENDLLILCTGFEGVEAGRSFSRSFRLLDFWSLQRHGRQGGHGPLHFRQSRSGLASGLVVPFGFSILSLVLYIKVF